MAEDTLDVISAEEAAAAVKLGGADPTVLEGAVTALSRRLDQLVGPIVHRTITGELHDGGRPVIWLDEHPVGSISQVVEYDETVAATLTAESPTSQPSSAYLMAGTANGQLIRREAGADANFAAGRQNIYVTYVAGRYATTGSVDALYKDAAVIWLKNRWRAEGYAVAELDQYDVPRLTFPTFSIPNAVKELLAGEWRTGSGIGS